MARSALHQEIDRLRREAAVLEAQALVLRQAADQIEAGMAAAASVERPERAADLKRSAYASQAPLAEAARAAGLTLRGLADRAGVSPASLTHYQRGRPVPARVAREVERLTGFAAWPGGVAPE